ncbi:MAG: sugar transferase, partial [Dehalococcoidia bacterium]|nr:sugar transferase [Dehalococcoidia bacterium]
DQAGQVGRGAGQQGGVARRAGNGARVMTRHQRAVAVGLALIDVALINIAFVLAYGLRYGTDIGPSVPDESLIPLTDYWPLQLALSVILLIAFTLNGQYRKPLQTGFIDDIGGLLSSTSIGMMLILSFVFFTQRFAYSRLMFVYVYVLALLLLIVWRLIKRRLVIYLYRQFIGVRRAVVIGNNPVSHMVMHLMTTDVGLGYKLFGFLTDGDAVQDEGRFRCLGSLDDLAHVIQKLALDEVVIAIPPSATHRTLEIVEICSSFNVAVKVVPGLYEMSLRRMSVDDLRGLPLVGVQDAAIAGLEQSIKRGMDIVLSLVAIVAFAPLWILIALAIKIDSPGPVLFSQHRVGQGGKLFKMYKFRSMRVDAEKVRRQLEEHNEAGPDGRLFKIRNDPRRTRVGGWLRRFSLDELPQIINVLLGDMSIVGPRPLIPEEVEKQNEWHRKRLLAKPGMTGLWQVSGRSDLPFSEMVLLDIYYIENWTLGLDLKILARTLPAVITARGAY